MSFNIHIQIFAKCMQANDVVLVTKTQDKNVNTKHKRNQGSVYLNYMYTTILDGQELSRRGIIHNHKK